MNKMKRTLWATGVLAVALLLCTMCKKGGSADSTDAQASADSVDEVAYVSDGKLVIPQRRSMDVNDYADVLGDSARALEDDLRMYAAEVPAEITVVTMTDIGGADPQKIAAEIASRWKVGKSGNADNGVVILLAASDAKPQAAIAVGSHLSDTLSARYCRDITTNVMTPMLTSGNYYGAVSAAVNDIVRTLASTQP